MRERGFGLLIYITAAALSATVAAAAPDPTSAHYSSGKMPPDPLLVQAKPLGRYRGFLRVAVDLSAKMPPVGDQGQLPASVAWAMAYAARGYYEAREDAGSPADPHNAASPAYVFHLARKGGCADGVTPSEIANVMREGALSIADYPYSATCAPPASPADVARAKDFKVRDVSVLDPARVDDIKAQVERGNPVVVSFRDGARFQAFRGDGVFEDPGFDPNAEEENYQALTVIGYDDRKQAVHVMNSWGQGWGDGGLAWIGYGTLATRISFALILNVPADETPLAVAAQAAPAASQPAATPAPDAELSAPNPFASADLSHGAPSSPTGPASTPIIPLGPDMRAPKSSVAAPTAAGLDDLACGHITRTRMGDQTILSGYVATPDDLNLIKATAAHEPNTKLGEVDVAPWPICEALGTLEKPLARQDTPRVTLMPSDVATEGDTLRIDVQAPRTPRFLYISYVQADGTVVTLSQPQAPVPAQAAPGEKLVFGDGQNGRPRFTVSAPFGAEMVVVLAAASPLFAKPLPAQENERDYLSALRAALLYKPVATLPDRDVSAAVQAITTRSRSAETAGRMP